MSKVRLPGTPFDVSRLCLGSTKIGSVLDKDESFRLLDAYVEAGGNFIDTALAYSDRLAGTERHASEKIIGRWLRARSGTNVVVATKGGLPDPDHPDVVRLDAASIEHDLKLSLGNLGVDCIDLHYLHRDDPSRPAAELIAPLAAAKGAGLVRAYGLSNWSPARLAAADAAAAANDWPLPVANQPAWSLAVRNPGVGPTGLEMMNADAFAWHERTGRPAICYWPQAKGYFDKVARGDVDAATAELFDNDHNRGVATILQSLAGDLGASPTEVMLAAMVRMPFPTIPIIGSRTIEQMRSSFRATTLELADDERTRRLEALFRFRD